MPQRDRRLEAVGVGEQLGELLPVGVVVEQQADDVATPRRPEVRRTEVLEGHHLVGLGPEGDPEAAGPRRRTRAPPSPRRPASATPVHAACSDALGEVQELAQALDPRRGGTSGRSEPWPWSRISHTAPTAGHRRPHVGELRSRHERPQRPGHPVRRRRPRRDLVPGAQDRARASAVDRRAEGPARPRRRGPRRRHRGLRGRGRQGRPGVDRRPGAGHPPRREGADRGVQRPRRARAHPQGDDLARPDRERRAAPGAPVAAAGAAARGGDAGPARPARRASTRRGDGRALAQRRRPGDHAGQAVRHRRRRDAGGARAARRPARALSAARHQGPDGHRPGHARPARRRRRPARLARAAGGRAPGLRAGAHQRRPGLPALAGLRRRLRARAGRRRPPRTSPPRSG